MRRDAALLNDVVAAGRKIQTIASACSEDSFLADEVRQAAVLHYLTVIGEAVNQLSPSIRERHWLTSWRQVVAVRNRIVHAYFDLDWEILWTTVADDVPLLLEQAKAVLEAEFPGQ